MVYANTASLPISEEVQELMEAHQKLVAEYGTILSTDEEDTYSLAQPSPLKFVPSIASGNAPVDCLGE